MKFISSTVQPVGYRIARVFLIVLLTLSVWSCGCPVCESPPDGDFIITTQPREILVGDTRTHYQVILHAPSAFVGADVEFTCSRGTFLTGDGGVIAPIDPHTQSSKIGLDGAATVLWRVDTKAVPVQFSAKVCDHRVYVTEQVVPVPKVEFDGPDNQAERIKPGEVRFFTIKVDKRWSGYDMDIFAIGGGKIQDRGSKSDTLTGITPIIPPDGIVEMTYYAPDSARATIQIITKIFSAPLGSISFSVVP